MKRIALTIAIIFGIALGASAQNRGLFDKGPDSGNTIDANHRDANLVFLVPYLQRPTFCQRTPCWKGGPLHVIPIDAANLPPFVVHRLVSVAASTRKNRFKIDKY